MTYRGIAAQTLQVIEQGGYRAPAGNTVDIGPAVARAKAGTRLYPPGSLDEAPGHPPTSGELTIEVTQQTTAQAGQRLVRERGPAAHVVALNFASARNPGGGFLGGAKAQEEDLARCSALYPCLLTQPRYYEANRAQASMLYTDHIIYSPDVPFFRDDKLDLLDEPFVLSIITAPAPNAGEALRRDPGCGPAIEAALRARTALVLATAAVHGHRALVLGAWGCGVFRNDPALVADSFAVWLAHKRFRRRFDHLCFAIYDRSPERTTWRAFDRRFALPDSGWRRCDC